MFQYIKLIARHQSKRKQNIIQAKNIKDELIEFKMVMAKINKIKI